MDEAMTSKPASLLKSIIIENKKAQLLLTNPHNAV